MSDCFGSSAFCKECWRLQLSLESTLAWIYLCVCVFLFQVSCVRSQLVSFWLCSLTNFFACLHMFVLFQTLIVQMQIQQPLMGMGGTPASPSWFCFLATAVAAQVMQLQLRSLAPWDISECKKCYINKIYLYYKCIGFPNMLTYHFFLFGWGWVCYCMCATKPGCEKGVSSQAKHE